MNVTINPIANTGQFAAEADVAAMWNTDAVRRARGTAAHLFNIFYGRDIPDQVRAEFDAVIDEYVTNYLFKAAASDAVHPRFVRDFMPAYRWKGRDVPGARMGGDNPDNCYRLAGIAHGGSYRVTGRPAGTEPAQVSFTLTGNYGTSVTIQTIENHHLQREPDGSFVITIDDAPANGRRNHMTTQPHVKFLFIRDSMEDWAVETPYALQIERIDAPTRAPLTVDEMAAQAAFRLVEEVPLYSWFQRLFTGLRPNSFRPPESSGGLGGLVTQAGIQGWYQLDADDAVLIRYQPAGATYVAVELTDFWFRSLDAEKLQSSLTRKQSVIDPDGWISAVIARKDPGVANWLDTGDLDTVLLMIRWQGLPGEPVAGGPAVTITKLKQAELRTHLSWPEAWIGAADRKRQIDARIAAWQRRNDA